MTSTPMLCDTARVTRSVAARTSTRSRQRSPAATSTTGRTSASVPTPSSTRSATSQATWPSSAGSPSGVRPGPSGLGGQHREVTVRVVDAEGCGPASARRRGAPPGSMRPASTPGLPVATTCQGRVGERAARRRRRGPTGGRRRSSPIGPAAASAAYVALSRHGHARIGSPRLPCGAHTAGPPRLMAPAPTLPFPLPDRPPRTKRAAPWLRRVVRPTGRTARPSTPIPPGSPTGSTPTGRDVGNIADGDCSSNTGRTMTTTANPPASGHQRRHGDRPQPAAMLGQPRPLRGRQERRRRRRTHHQPPRARPLGASLEPPLEPTSAEAGPRSAPRS